MIFTVLEGESWDFIYAAFGLSFIGVPITGSVKNVVFVQSLL